MLSVKQIAHRNVKSVCKSFTRNLVTTLNLHTKFCRLNLDKLVNSCQLVFQNFKNSPKVGKNTWFGVKEGQYTVGIRSFNILVSIKF